MTDTAALTLSFINIKKSISLAVHSTIRAIDIADTTSDAPVFVPLRQCFNAIAGLEWFCNALIKQLTVNHLL